MRQINQAAGLVWFTIIENLVNQQILMFSVVKNGHSVLSTEASAIRMQYGDFATKQKCFERQKLNEAPFNGLLVVEIHKRLLE